MNHNEEGRDWAGDGMKAIICVVDDYEAAAKHMGKRRDPLSKKCKEKTFYVKIKIKYACTARSLNGS